MLFKLKKSVIIKKAYLLLFLFLISLISFTSASAHVELNMPVGGETFFVGSRIEIQWRIIIPHNQENWDLYFSPDGGNNWEIIQLDLDNSVFSYLWLVPQIATEQGRIRINMDNFGGDYDAISTDFTIKENATSVRGGTDYPQSFALYPNYPNPFNPETSIPFFVDKTQNIKLQIFSISGKQIRTIIDASFVKGYFEAIWNGTNNNGENVASGVYFSKLQGDDTIKMKQLLLIR